jgi:CheY-specific phosphatase CheX
MRGIIKESVKNYLESIEASFNECDNKNIKGYVSKVSISGDVNGDIYIVIPKRKLDLVSQYWFGDENYEIEELVNEIANMIVGNAKVVAQKKGINFNISIPLFLGENIDNLEYDDILAFEYYNVCFYLLFKER